MENKNQDLDMEQAQRNLKKLIERNLKPKLSNRIGELFESIAMFTIICLAIIFRPVNLLIGGLIAIIILLII